jgi:drug/metabolite transporter (DMT)-like permease
MLSSHLVGVLLALSSAITFGSSDFYGGLATRRSNQYQVLAIATFVGIIVMAALAWLFGEGLPGPGVLLWAGLGGISGALGLAALYYGLSRGNAAIVSPVSGVVSASLPVIFGAFTAGLPNQFQLAGFILALPGIWLVTLSPESKREIARSGFLLGLLSGIAFGLFFIFIGQIEKGAIFTPLAVAKAASWVVAMVMLGVTHNRLPSFKANPLAVFSGVIDPLANAMYLLATHFTRLDVAAVLTSLYPAGTVFLSRLIIKEQITRPQWMGVGLCLVAIILITL